MADKSKKPRTFIKDIISVLGSNVAVLLISILLSIIVTRQLGPENKGVFAAITAYPMLLVHLVDMGIRQATTFHIGKKIFPEKQVMTGTLMLFIISSIVGITLSAVLLVSLHNPFFTAPLILTALLNVPVMLFISYSSGVFLGKEMIAEFSGMRWLPVALNFLLAWLLVVLFHLSVLGALVAMLVSNSAMAIYAAWLFWKKTDVKFQFSIKVIKAMIITGMGFSLPLFVISLTYRFSMIMMERLSTESELGLFSTSLGMIEMLWQVPAALGVVMFSRSANAVDGTVFTKQATRLFRVCLVAMLALGVLGMLLAPQIMELLYGAKFRASGILFQIVLPGAIVLTTFKVLNMDLLGKGKPYLATLAMVPAFLVGLALNFWLIPLYDAKGAAISAAVSYSVGGLLFIPVYLRATGSSLSDLFRITRDDFTFLRFLRKRNVAPVNKELTATIESAINAEDEI